MSRLKIERTSYPGWGLYLRSADDEQSDGRINLRTQWHWLTLRIPPILPPVRHWRDLSAMVGHPSYKWLKPGADGRYGYTEVIPREFSISYGDGYLHLRYGRQTHDSSTEQSKCWPLPWLQWRHVRHSLYQPDGSLVGDVPRGWRDPERERLEAAQQSVRFDFRDFDGEDITATCRVEEREWRLGTGWFRWLSLFARPKIDRSLKLDFSAEVGPRKGSWKGGTLGHGISMEPGEGPAAAFLRYCAKNNLTFTGAP